MNIHYAGQIGGAFGWGVCGENLTRELAKHYTLTGADAADVIFMPLADHDLNPATAARARINVGYTFFESELGLNAAANAARYDVVFAGSTWCLERMKERGITNGQILIQGVDYSVFKPAAQRESSRLRIFSGGKFEWRKGQDLVIAAFREFAKSYPDAELVCAWNTPWPQLIQSMVESPFIKFDGVTGRDQCELFENLLLRNGLAQDQFTILPQLSQKEMAREMAETDFGLFPNRCEGGTNLVLMEYLACARRAVANLKTGHADLADADIHEIRCGTDRAKWAHQSIHSIVDAMHECADAENAGSPEWTWAESAQTVKTALDKILLHSAGGT